MVSKPNVHVYGFVMDSEGRYSMSLYIGSVGEQGEQGVQGVAWGENDFVDCREKVVSLQP